MTAKGDQPAEAASRARLFHALADPSRMTLLERLRRGPASVGTLAAGAGLGQSNTSNHLAVLGGCHLVTRERRGRQVFYALARAEVEEILRLAERVAGDAAGPAGPDAGGEGKEGAC